MCKQKYIYIYIWSLKYEYKIVRYSWKIVCNKDDFLTIV